VLPFFLLEQESQLKTSQRLFILQQTKPVHPLGEAALPKPELATKPVPPPSRAKQKAHPPGTTKPFIICVLCGGDAGINDHHSAVPALFFFFSTKKK
jgi:hypothetical protein